MTSTYFAVIFVQFFLIDYKLILKSTKSRCTAKFMGTTQELLACHNNFFCLKDNEKGFPCARYGKLKSTEKNPK